MTARVDVLVLSLGTTRGLRIADAKLASLMRASGASVALVGTQIGETGRLRRAYPLTDLVEALAARRALRAGIRRYDPRALVLSTTTSTLLAGSLEIPFAVWLDSPASLNRPGRRNAVLHALERRRLAAARLVLAHSQGAIDALPAHAAPAIVLAPPIDGAPQRRDARERLAVAYTPDPKAKALDLVCASWTQAALPDARLIVVGIQPSQARAFLRRRGCSLPASAQLAGMLPAPEFGELLGRARVFLSAARWEDFGQAPLEALDCGAALVCAPSGGPFPALGIARELSPEFVSPDRTPQALASALGAAFAAEEPVLARYRQAALQRLEPYRPQACVKRIREEVLPALLGG